MLFTYIAVRTVLTNRQNRQDANDIKQHSLIIFWFSPVYKEVTLSSTGFVDKTVLRYVYEILI